MNLMAPGGNRGHESAANAGMINHLRRQPPQEPFLHMQAKQYVAATLSACDCSACPLLARIWFKT